MNHWYKIWSLTSMLLCLASPAYADPDFGGGGGEPYEPDGPVEAAIIYALQSTVWVGPTYAAGMFTSTTSLLATGELAREPIIEYLNEDTPNVEAALHTGGGAGAHDLYALFRVRHLSPTAFGRLLRAERAALLPLLSGAAPDAFITHLALALTRADTP